MLWACKVLLRSQTASTHLHMSHCDCTQPNLLANVTAIRRGKTQIPV
jgi:hypothetical protein